MLPGLEERRAQLRAAAEEVLGAERTAALERELAERAWHLAVVDRVPLDGDDAPLAWPTPPG
jgi:hypothetical protein